MRLAKFEGYGSTSRVERISMETTDDIQQDDSTEESGGLEWQLQRLQRSVVDSFTPEQRQAVITAIDASMSA